VLVRVMSAAVADRIARRGAATYPATIVFLRGPRVKVPGVPDRP
jgi:hypothetical protein